MRLRALSPRDLPLATTLLQQTWPYDHFRRSLVREKLFDDAPGQSSLALGLFGKGLEAFVALVSHDQTAWMKLAAVGRPFRGRGHLRRLLAEATKWAQARRAKTLRLMDHAGNYWTPGVDVRYAEVLAVLGKMGFHFVRENYNLSCPSSPLPARGARFKPAGVVLRRAERKDKHALTELAQQFHPAWVWELARAFHNRPPSIHIAEARGKLVAFAAHDANNRSTGAFGPAGTLLAWRGQGIGERLLRRCLQDVAQRRQPDVTIAWASETTLYERVGARLSGRYHVLAKRL